MCWQACCKGWAHGRGGRALPCSGSTGKRSWGRNWGRWRSPWAAKTAFCLWARKTGCWPRNCNSGAARYWRGPTPFWSKPFSAQSGFLFCGAGSPCAGENPFSRSRAGAPRAAVRTNRRTRTESIWTRWIPHRWWRGPMRGLWICPAMGGQGKNLRGADARPQGEKVFSCGENFYNIHKILCVIRNFFSVLLWNCCDFVDSGTAGMLDVGHADGARQETASNRTNRGDAWTRTRRWKIFA